MKSEFEIKKIIVKPVPRVSVQARQTQQYHMLNIKTVQTESGSQMNKNKAKNAAETLVFDNDLSLTRMKTGLEEKIANPYKGMDKLDLQSHYGLSDHWEKYIDKILEEDEISLQRHYEILDGVDPEDYSPKIKSKRLPKSVFRDPASEPSFVETFSYTFYDRANVITNETTRGRFAIQLAKNNSLVCPDRNYNPNVHRFYIAEENEEQLEQAKKDDLINEAVFKLFSLEKDYPQDALERVSKLLTNSQGIPLVKGKVPSITIKANLNNYIKQGGKEWRENLKKFDRIYSLFIDNKERFKIELAVQEAINENLMQINNGYVFWHSQMNKPELYKWSSLDKLAGYLMTEYDKFNPANSEVSNAWAILSQELNAKGIKI